MKLLVLTAIIAAVASSPLSQGSTWPWQVGKEYSYDVNTYTWTEFDQSKSNGNSFKAQFIIRVLAPGHLLAKLEQPLYAPVNDEVISYNVWPKDLKYQPVEIVNEPFEIFLDGGRVKSFSVPKGLSLNNENLLKGLISALQVDISAYGHVHSFANSFDKDSFQGLFKKMETDVTGECETLYTVSPISAEWHRELPEFASEPIEIVKSTNYGSCQKRVAFDFGVPEGAVWEGLAYENEEKQFIKHTSESRILAGKQGTIYKSEKISSVFVSPLIFGKQKAEVYSFVKAYLSAVKPISGAEWKNSVESRQVNSLLFTFDESVLVLKSNGQRVADAQKLLQDMTPLLQNPNKMPKADFLAKYTILVRIIASLNSAEIDQLSKSVEIAKSSKNVEKLGMWTIYRDAVAQAGTVTAFNEIKSWVFAKKIEGEEAGQVISGIGSTLVKPNKKIMADFFDFAMHPEIREQKIVNNSALLAATKLTRFGKEELFVVETVIPRLAKELKLAVESGDFNKAQVFVTVLGNLAHPEILKVFAPYMDGTVAVTKYLRIQMVVNLKPLANLKNEQVRAVLFSIIRNTAEPYEIRAAAALNIFLAFPTAEMMQILAHMTNDDPSTQVRAVLANTINFAAGLKDPRFAELSKTAQSVKNLIAKEKLGYRYSTASLMDTYTNDDDYVIFRELAFIGSNDNIFPKYQRTALRARGSGLTEENQITLSVSDVQQLLEYVAQLVYEPTKSDVDFKFSAQKVIDMLKIKRERKEPLQGAMFLENLNQQKLITFTEEDLKDFLISTVKNMEQLFKGIDIQYTKVLFHDQVLVIFPLAAGVPFFFDYSEPLVYSINGPVKVKFDKGSKDLAGTLKKDLNFTYARNLDGIVGFQDTLGNKYTYSGVINKIQFYLPLKLETTYKPGDSKLKFELPKQDATFVHLSVWPYTTSQKIDSILTVSENPATKYIERPAKVVSTDVNIGDVIGVSLQLQGYSYSNDFKNLKQLYETDILTSFGTLLYQKDVALTNFNLKYHAKETKNKEITFSTYFNTLYNQKNDGELGPASLVKDVSANSAARREEFVKRSAAGIESPQVQLIDLSAVFDGEKKVEYVFTAAIAESFVDDKVQAVFFFNGYDQINAVFKMVKPKVVPLNFEKALKNKNKVTFEAELKYGSSDSIIFKGFGERTEKYTEMLLKDPLTKQCLEETSQDNFYQMGCYKMIIKAHAPDYYKATVSYKDLSPSYLEVSSAFYEFFKKIYDWEQEDDFTKTLPDGTFEIESKTFYYEDYANYVLKSKYGVFRLDKVEFMHYWQYADAFYAPISDWERSRNWFTGYQHLPYCAVEKSKIWTFGGRSYEYSLSGSWHVVMVDESNDAGKFVDLVILARRPSDNHEEIYISYKTEAAKYLEVYIKPDSVDVKTNAKKVSSGALTSYWNDEDESPLLEYYSLAEGVLVFNINDQAIRLIYDGQRLVIFTDDHRSYTRGICGESTSEARDDYMTPFGFVDQPSYYGAAFSLEGEFSDPKTVELKKQAKLKAYQPVTKYTSILFSDSEWNKIDNSFAKGL